MAKATTTAATTTLATIVGYDRHKTLFRLTLLSDSTVRIERKPRMFVSILANKQEVETPCSWPILTEPVSSHRDLLDVVSSNPGAWGID